MKKYRNLLIGILTVILVGFIIPENRVNPVLGASKGDWNAQSFWYEPWGSSGVHKGVDIFAQHNTPVRASTHQMILYKGSVPKGGVIILSLGAKWRLHYYAHLADTVADLPLFISSRETIGSVGDTGNAKGKPPHLHYVVLSLLPLPWKVDSSTQGFKKAFYLDPEPYLIRTGSL
ncbi:Membrane proteins related to metalloendopeptidases [Alteromonadaceae bacterium Bs31]|nr:Membrane proteins related to metalloendopeptidases [Alteromonadaceae bacterium Bs31]